MTIKATDIPDYVFEEILKKKIGVIPNTINLTISAGYGRLVYHNLVINTLNELYEKNYLDVSILDRYSTISMESQDALDDNNIEKLYDTIFANLINSTINEMVLCVDFHSAQTVLKLENPFNVLITFIKNATEIFINDNRLKVIPFMIGSDKNIKHVPTGFTS